MIRALALAAAVALIAGISAGAAGAGSETPDALIADAMNAPARVSYAGQVEFVKIGAHGSEASVYAIVHRAPDRTLRTYSSPASLAGDAVLQRGAISDAIDARRRRVVESRNAAVGDQTALSANYLLLRANYHAQARGDDRMAGRRVRVVALVSDRTQKTVAIASIDAGTGLLLDEQRFGPQGGLVSEMRFESVRYPARIADATFALPSHMPVVHGPQRDVPSDRIDTLAARSGFDARAPHELPGGFVAVEGEVLSIKHIRTLEVLYSDGLRTVSLFENAKTSGVDLAAYRPQSTDIAGRTAQYGERGPTTLLVWSAKAIHYALVGELTLPELQACAKRLMASS